MSPVLLFVLLLLLIFGVSALVLKPGQSEVDLQRHLRSIGGMYVVDAEGATILKPENLSSIPWLNALLERVPGCFKLRLFILQSGSEWSVAALLLGSVLAVLTVTWIAGLFLPSPLLALLVGLGIGCLPYLYLHVKRQARFNRFDKLLPEAVDLMSRALKAGHGVVAAIEMVSEEIADPVGPEFRVVFEEQNLGLPIREAIFSLVQRVPLDDMRFLATAMLVQKETGGNLAEVLDKTSTVMRERNRLKGQLRIYTAQGRVTAWVLCLLPFILFLVFDLVNHDYERKLWTEPTALHLIYVGLVMMVFGILVIRKIVNIKI
jgi:tight adherence protein B